MRALYDQEGYGPWSTTVSVRTTRKTVSGEDLHKAISAKDIAHLRNILDPIDLGGLGFTMIDVPDKLGFSPLMSASQKGHARIVEELILRGADVGFANSSGKTSLMLAAFAGSLPVVEILIKEQADIHVVDLSGCDALNAAVTGEHADVVKYLLEIPMGGRVNERDKISESTPLLRCAAVGGNSKVCEILLQFKADPNVRNRTGSTPLMLAAIGGHEEMVRRLLLL